jgi:hypothetical protein
MKKEKKGMHCHLKGTASLSKRGRMAIKKKKKGKGWMAFDSKTRILRLNEQHDQTSLVCRPDDTLFKRGRSLFSRQIRKW